MKYIGAFAEIYPALVCYVDKQPSIQFRFIVSNLAALNSELHGITGTTVLALVVVEILEE